LSLQENRSVIKKQRIRTRAMSQLLVTKFRRSMHAALRTISVYLKD